MSCRLLAQLGAGQGGPVQVVVTDVREEMVAYVAGRPYLRRELEMPAAAFHHAGLLSYSMPQHLLTFRVAQILRQLAGLGSGVATDEPVVVSDDSPFPGSRPTAGIRAAQLERLEAALAADLASEAEAWGGRLLLHAEPWAYLPANSSGSLCCFVEHDLALSLHVNVRLPA